LHLPTAEHLFLKEYYSSIYSSCNAIHLFFKRPFILNHTEHPNTAVVKCYWLFRIWPTWKGTIQESLQFTQCRKRRWNQFNPTWRLTCIMNKQAIKQVICVALPCWILLIFSCATFWACLSLSCLEMLACSFASESLAASCTYLSFYFKQNY